MCFNKITLTFLNLILFSYLHSQTTAVFLKFPSNSKMLSLGGTQVATNDGISNIMSNPASLNITTKGELIFNGLKVIDDITYNNLLAGFRTRTGRIGFVVSQTDSGKIEGRDINRNRTTTFRTTDRLIGMNYTLAIDRNSAFGVNIKYILLDIADESAGTIAFDAGYQQDNIINGLNIGAALRNLGGMIRFYKNNEKLPLNISIGLSYKIEHNVFVAMNITRWIYEMKTDFSIGSEYMFVKGIYLRCGYNTNDRGLKSLKYGIGLNLAGITLDYALIPFDMVGNIQSITLGVKF